MQNSFLKILCGFSSESLDEQILTGIHNMDILVDEFISKFLCYSFVTEPKTSCVCLATQDAVRLARPSNPMAVRRTPQRRYPDEFPLRGHWPFTVFQAACLLPRLTRIVVCLKKYFSEMYLRGYLKQY